MKIVALAACLSATAFGGVVFTDDFELAGAWSMAGRGFAVLPGEGEKGTAGLVWEGKEPDGGWQFYRHDFTGKVGHVYRLTVKAQSTEDVVGRAYVRLVSKTADGKRQNFFQNGMPIINNGWKKNHVGWWTEIRTETPPLPDGGTGCCIEFAVMSRTTGRLRFDNLRLEEGEKVVFNYVTSSAYRDRAAEGTVKFAAYYQFDEATCPASARTGLFVFTDADGRPLEVPAETTATHFTASADVARLKTGRQTVKVQLRDGRTGKVLEETGLGFERVAKLPPVLACFDADQQFVVDGRPMFALGCYGCGRDEKETDLYASAGFNCAISSDPAAIARLTKRGLKAIVSAGGGLTGTVQRAVARYGTNRNVIAWYTADELPIGFARSQIAIQKYLHALDPERPTLTVLDQPKHSRDHMASYDVIGTDPYPVGNNAPLSICSTYPETVREYTFGMRPVWQVPQAFDWHWHRRNFRFGMKEHRFPNREEFRSMSWQPIACGVTGLLWYDFDWFMKDLPKEEFEATWVYVKETVSKIAAHTEVFLSREKTVQPKTDEKKVRARAWRHGGVRWVLVCNTSAEKVTCRVEGDCEGTMAAVEGPLPMREGGACVYALAPHDVSFVKFAR